MNQYRLLLLGPPGAGKSSLVKALSFLMLPYYNLDTVIFELCRKKSLIGPLPDEIIREATLKFISMIPEKGSVIAELPYHDYLDIISNGALNISRYDGVILLTSSYKILCHRNKERENSVPELYIARSLGSTEALLAWLGNTQFPWLRFDMDLFTVNQVANSILDFLRRTESTTLSRLSIAPIPSSPYLGGHLVNETELDRKLINELRKRYDIRTVLDIGCGTGLSLDYFEEIGIQAWGVEGNLAILDGPSQIKQHIMVVDFTKQWLECPVKMDLIWCVEVIEHIHPQHESNIIRSICSNAAQVVFLTAAKPDQPGYNHVNCRPQEYWINKFEGNGLKYVKETNNILARLDDKGSLGMNFLKENGMLFEVCL